jgi:hypothetical protein
MGEQSEKDSRFGSSGVFGDEEEVGRLKLDAKQQVLNLLKSSGAVLLRTNKHRVWKLPSGLRYTLPSTPSDKRGWLNCLSDLRIRLGIKHAVKKQLDFEHKKKQAYEKPEVSEKPFMAGASEPEDRPAVPVSLSPVERAKLPPEEPPREIVTYMGRIPTRLGKRGGGRKSGRCGDVYTYSAEVLQHASFLVIHEGDAAAKLYLDGIKNGTANLVTEEKNKMEQQGNGKVISASGGLEDLIKQKKEEIRVWQNKEEQAHLEVLRAGKILETLEQALTLTTASRQVIQGNVQVHTNGEKHTRGFWRKTIEEVVGTNPFQLTKQNLHKELRKVHPTLSFGAIYQGIRQGFGKGWLVEDEKTHFVTFVSGKDSGGEEVQ